MKIRGDDDAQADSHAAMQARSLEDGQPRRPAATKTSRVTQAGRQPQAGKQAGRQASRQTGNRNLAES